MIIISKKDSKRLVKGGRYEVMSLYNNGNNNRWLEGTVYIKDLGRFSVENFTDSMGGIVPKLNILPENQSLLKFEELKKGDIIVCISSSYKTLMKDGFYRIENLDVLTKNTNYNGRTFTNTTKFIKLEGIKRRLTFNTFNFRKLNTDEFREINLNQLLKNESVNIIKSENIKKIDLVKNKNEFLLKALAKSICDSNRNNLSIIDWTCKKVEDKMGLNNKDFDTLMSLTLKEILEILD